MKIYKAKVIHDLVVEAKSADEAVRAIELRAEIEGIPVQIERFTQVHSLDQLPRGWTSESLALSSYERPRAGEHSIRYWLEEQSGVAT